MTHGDPEARPGRRRFLRLLGLAGLWSPFVSRPLAFAAQSGGSGAREGPKAPADSTASPPAATAAPAGSEKKISDEAEALAEFVKRRHGEHLSEDDLRRIAGYLDDRLETGRKLATLKLRNGDEPDFEFRA